MALIDEVTNIFSEFIDMDTLHHKRVLWNCFLIETIICDRWPSNLLHIDNCIDKVTKFRGLNLKIYKTSNNQLLYFDQCLKINTYFVLRDGINSITYSYCSTVLMDIFWSWQFLIQLVLSLCNHCVKILYGSSSVPVIECSWYFSFNCHNTYRLSASFCN